MSSNTLDTTDIASKKFLEIIGDIAQNTMSKMTIRERVEAFKEVNRGEKEWVGNFIDQMTTKVAQVNKIPCPEPKGKNGSEIIIIGECHGQSLEYSLYPRLIKDLAQRGYKTLTYELPNDKEGREKTERSKEIAKDKNLTEEEIETISFEEGLEIAMIYAFKAGMAVKLIDMLGQRVETINIDAVPEIPFDPENPESITGWDELNRSSKKDAKLFNKRNQIMTEGILQHSKEKVVHLGGQNHNKYLQSMLAEITGVIPLSIILKYPTREISNESKCNTLIAEDFFDIEKKLNEISELKKKPKTIENIMPSI